MKKILLSVIALFAAICVKATVLWEGPLVFDGWSVSFVIESDKFADVKAGDIIRVNYTDKKDDFNPIYKHVEDWSDWTDFQGAVDWQDGYFQAAVTEGAIAELQSKGLRFQGVGVTMTSVELITEGEEGGEEGGSEGGEEGGSESGEVTYAVFNVDNALGLDKENGTSLTAGTELFNEEEGVLTIGADDTYKPQEVAFAVNDKEAVKGGLQGATNPKDADGGFCSETLKEPAAGAFFTFEAKKDGFLYVIHKASANKAYTVFEEGTAIGYKFAAVGDAATDLGAIYQFELKGEGEVNEVKEKVLFAEQLFLQGTDKYDSHLDADGNWVVIKNAEDKAISGLGVIVFPVFADCKYKFNANGYKMTLAGIAFSDADDLTIKTDDGVEIYNGGGATAIQGAKVVTVAGNSAIYNLAGQKVNASYKGIVIKDGKKYIQK